MRVTGWSDGGERRVGEPHQFGVVEADHRNVIGHVEATLADGSDRTERHHVARGHDAGDAGVEEPLRSGETAVEREDRLDDPIIEITIDADRRSLPHGSPASLRCTGV